MRTVFSCLFIVLLSITQDTGSAVNLPSNRAIIDSLTIEIFTANMRGVNLKSNDSVAIDVNGLHRESADYLRILLGNVLAGNSFIIFRNYNQASSFQGLIIEVDEFNTKVFYSKPFEKSFFGKNYVLRRIEIEVNGQMFWLHSQRVEKAIRDKISFKDEILYSAIDQVEDSAYHFTHGQLEDFSFWDKIFEPALALASVGILVYLFFSQRS
jgi:hypothetical protein